MIDFILVGKNVIRKFNPVFTLIASFESSITSLLNVKENDIEST